MIPILCFFGKCCAAAMLIAFVMFMDLLSYSCALQLRRPVLKSSTSTDYFVNEVMKTTGPMIIYKDQSRRSYISRLLQESLRLPRSHSSSEELPIVDLTEISKWDVRQKDSLFVWFDDDILSPSDHLVREQCMFSLCLLGEEVSGESRGGNQRLVNFWAAKLLRLEGRGECGLEAGHWSHFLSLTYPDLKPHTHLLPQLSRGVDAFELRVDLLGDISAGNVHRQVSLLRASCPLPLVYTVRTKGQIGKFPDNALEDIEQLLMEGIRAGVEWLDVEANLPAPLIQRLLSQIKLRSSVYSSRVLGSLHVTTAQSEEGLEEMFQLTKLGGGADLCKVVAGAENDEDCRLVQRVAQRTCSSMPYIAICLGSKGELSRVLNRRFTPVTHPLLSSAAPGQLSVETLMSRRQSLGLVSKKDFYLFGYPIKHSLSPAMHNSAFQQLSLPHSYALCEAEDVEGCVGILKEEGFAGASVTIPYKESVMIHLDRIDEVAQRIGAVNTIVIEEGVSKIDSGLANDAVVNTAVFVGYNTDWLGMLIPIERLLKRKALLARGTHMEGIGLVIGAGGTARAACYVMKYLGLKLYIANRSQDKADELADRFGGIAVDYFALSQNIAAKELSVVISTLPSAAAFLLPPDLLENRPVVLDVVYKPAWTPLLQQAAEAECSFVQGATMLLEQGVKQFQHWTKRTAPIEIMVNSVYSDEVPKIDST